MIFCPLLVVQINFCLRLNFFSSFSSSSLSPESPHLTSLTPCFRLPRSLTLPLPSLPLLLPPFSHLSLFCPPSPSFSLTPSPFTLHIFLSLPLHISLYTAPSLLPLLPSFSSPPHSSILIDYVNLVFVVVVGPVCDAVYWYAECHNDCACGYIGCHWVRNIILYICSLCTCVYVCVC